MDNQRDFYIKEKFKQDDLISKKADDVFNNFFKGEIKMEAKTDNPKIEEKVVDINVAKDNKFKMKRIMSMVATLVVVFLSVNVYAATQGYNNIFFIIRNLVKSESVNNREEILSDKDITISYQPIEVADNLNIQINGLRVSENVATLTLKIDEKYPLKYCPKKFIVYDVTGERKDLLGKQVNLKTNENKTSGEASYVEELELLHFKNDTNNLMCEIFDQNNSLIASFEIDLENKSIDVLSSQNNKLQKISETELKEVLGIYARFLLYDAFNAGDFYDTREAFNKDTILENAMLLILENENSEIRKNGYSLEEVHNVIKEISGTYYEEPIDSKYSLIDYDKEKKCYVFENGDALTPALCLDIQDISFYNGIYTIDYVYCFAGETDFIENSVESLDKFKSTIQLALNDDYKYAKYCIRNLNEMTGTSYIEDSYEIKDTSSNKDEDDVRDDLLMSDELIQFDTKFYNIQDIAKAHWYAKEDESGGIIKYDLDKDGIDEVIKIKKEEESNNNYGEDYVFYVNDTKFASNGLNLYIVDFNENDNNVEIVIFSAGPSDDPVYSVYSKIGNEVILQGIAGFSYELKTDKKGNILSNSWYDNKTTPTIYFRYFFIKDNQFEEKIVDVEELKNIKIKLKSELVTDVKYKTYYFTENFEKIEKYQKYENLDEIEALDANTEFELLDVEIVKTSEDFWSGEDIYKIKIKLEDGRVGYLYHIQWAG